MKTYQQLDEEYIERLKKVTAQQINRERVDRIMRERDAGEKAGEALIEMDGVTSIGGLAKFFASPSCMVRWKAAQKMKEFQNENSV